MSRVIRHILQALTLVLSGALSSLAVVDAAPPVPPGIEMVPGVARAHWRLTELFKSGQITKETALQAATNAADFLRNLEFQ